MKNRRSATRHFVVLTAILLTRFAAAAPPPLEWNVFLGPWQILGPFPCPSPEDGAGLRTDYLAGEPQCNPATTVDYAGVRTTAVGRG